jgi:hypothetical protein
MPATLLAGMGSLHHPIATNSSEAQRFFDQGLTFIYAFNHGEAVHSFERAAQLDPHSPMPLWGKALALGSRRQQPSKPSAPLSWQRGKATPTSLVSPISELRRLYHRICG